MRTKIKELKFQKRALAAWLVLSLVVIFAMAITGTDTLTMYDVATGTASCGILIFIVNYMEGKEKAKGEKNETHP